MAKNDLGKIYPEVQERFKLSSHDTYKAIRHTQKEKAEVNKYLGARE